jgi:hypothetical protein
MKTFKQKSLYAALAGVSALGVTGAAQAVNVNPDGLGQVLIYPYYTTREDASGNAFSSLLTVVNSTASAKAVKVRFIEGKASKEVLDFNLFLSAHDVWTAAIQPVTGGAAPTPHSTTGDGAGVGTADASCTFPKVGTTLVPFKNSLLGEPYMKDNSLDRTREGYAEIIEMGSIVSGSALEKTVTHDPTTEVPKCDPAVLATSAINAGTGEVIYNALVAGGLFGDMTLINVDSGSDYTEDAVALDNFRNTATYVDPGQILPDLTQVEPPVSVVVGKDQDPITFPSGTVYISGWDNPIDAISALFMHDHVYNTFILDVGTKSGTDWVLNFPTKRYYYENATGEVDYLFQRNFAPDGTGACDDIVATIYDREEGHATASVGFSPPEPNPPNTLCWEANVVTFNSSKVLNSTNLRNIDTTYANGWVDVSFNPADVDDFTTDGPFDGHVLFSDNSLVLSIMPTGDVQVSGADATYIGLPVIGFAVETYVNAGPDAISLPTPIMYGGSFLHKGTRSIPYIAEPFEPPTN